MNEQWKSIYEGIVKGEAADAKDSVYAALKAGVPAEDILNQYLIPAMKRVGDKFENGEYYLPEMLIAARAMQAVLDLLKPLLASVNVKSAGKIVIGTVHGDLHDIGKNLVGMMLEGAGFDLIDLGIDVMPENFVEAVRVNKPKIVAMSALLTTTIPAMKATIAALETAGLRAKVKVVIGGAAVTEEYAREIGADGYAPDASRAANLVRTLVEQ